MVVTSEVAGNQIKEFLQFQTQWNEWFINLSRLALFKSSLRVSTLYVILFQLHVCWFMFFSLLLFSVIILIGLDWLNTITQVGNMAHTVNVIFNNEYWQLSWQYNWSWMGRFCNLTLHLSYTLFLFIRTIVRLGQNLKRHILFFKHLYVATKKHV